MKGQNFSKAVLVLVMVVLVGAFGLCTGSYAASDKPVQLKLSNWLPETGTEGKMGKWWGSELEKRCQGLVNIDYYFAQALVKTMDSLPAVSSGIADVQFVAEGYFPSQLPLLGGLHLLYQTESGWVMGKGQAEMCESFEPFQKMMRNSNIIPAIYVPATEVVIASVKPIRKLEDLKGKKVRAMGLMNKAMKMLGATPVAMPLPEVYESLERGTLDVITGIPYHLVVAFKLHEVAKYIVGPHMGCYATGAYYMNRDVWSNLPDQMKKAIEDLRAEHLDVYIEMTNKLHQKTTEALRAGECDIYSLPQNEVQRWRDKLVPKIYDDWKDEMKKKDLPGKEVLEAYQKLIKKFEPMDKYKSPFEN